MKKIIIGFLLLNSALGFSASVTDLSSKWTCTTNASSSDVAADKAADDKMAKAQSSATESFGLASKNCRDCTKITCEANN